MGGDLSHEFHLISKSGDTDIYYDKKIGDINGLNTRNSFKLLRNLYSVTKDEYKKKQDLDASKLIKTKGIEIGHIFYFGTKYSDKLDAYVLNEKGQKINVEMGSYGIGISRLVAAIIESSHDEKGIIWPKNISPFNVGLINLNNKNKELIRIADKLYDYLKKNNIDVLYDDTNERPGEKFANIDLIGVPSQIILGENSLKENSVEIKNRKTKKIIKIKTKNMNEIIKKI